MLPQSVHFGDVSEQNPLGHSSSEWELSIVEAIVLECAHLGYSWLKVMKLEKQKDAGK